MSPSIRSSTPGAKGFSVAAWMNHGTDQIPSSNAGRCGFRLNVNEAKILICQNRKNPLTAVTRNVEPALESAVNDDANLLHDAVAKRLPERQGQVEAAGWGTLVFRQLPTSDSTIDRLMVLRL